MAQLKQPASAPVSAPVRLPSASSMTSGCRIPFVTRLMRRPELGAAAGLILVTIFFLSTADSSMFTLAGIMNILTPSVAARHPRDRRRAPDDRRRVRSVHRLDGGLLGPHLRQLPASRRPSVIARDPRDLRRGGRARCHRTARSSFARGCPPSSSRWHSCSSCAACRSSGLKWATGGSTQMRGIGEQAGEGIVRELFSGNALEGSFRVACRA